MSRRSTAAARAPGGRYSTAIKLAIVRAVVVDGAKVAAVAEHRKISQALIYQWLKLHRSGKLPLPEPKQQPAPKPKPPGSIADRQLSLAGQQPVTVSEPVALAELPKPVLVEAESPPPSELVVRAADSREAELLQLLAERDAKIAALTRTIRVLRQTVDGLLPE